MRFGAVPLADAAGAILAHAVRGAESVVRKGSLIGPAEIAAFAAAGVSEVVVARLEPGDVDENTAAERLAIALAGPHTVREAPFTGRVNLFAEAAGVLMVDADAIDAANAVDEAVTVATLERFRPVVAGEMIATAKIIPFSVPEAVLARAVAAAAGAVRIAPYRLGRIAVVSTLLPTLKPSVVDKTLKVLADRLQPTGARIVSDARVDHTVAALAPALDAALGGAADLVVVFGASAVTDRRDVVPAAIEAVGGRIDHLGMPVDPGNLLLLGRAAGKPVVGAPGCARSPKENGFDRVLTRLIADVPVGRADIQGMGVGGLLMEIVSRPQPRAPVAPSAPVGAIILAAGRSTRMGERFKLIEPVGGVPMVRRAAEAALASGARPVLVVTGHRAADVAQVLHGLDVSLVHNPAFADGLSTSLKAGFAALPEDRAAALVLLADMPRVTGALLDRLIGVFGAEGAGALAVAPVAGGRRGNPVLIARPLMAALGALTGDVGARALLDAAGEQVVEVPVADDAVLVDVDTPEALAAARAGG